MRKIITPTNISFIVAEGTNREVMARVEHNGAFVVYSKEGKALECFQEGTPIRSKHLSTFGIAKVITETKEIL